MYNSFSENVVMSVAKRWGCEGIRGRGCGHDHGRGIRKMKSTFYQQQAATSSAERIKC